jgi:alpha-galactosidase
LWHNDPDCVMLRTRNTALTPDAARRWARWAAQSGGMLTLSDSFADLDAPTSRFGRS